MGLITTASHPRGWAVPSFSTQRVSARLRLSTDVSRALRLGAIRAHQSQAPRVRLTRNRHSLSQRRATTPRLVAACRIDSRPFAQPRIDIRCQGLCVREAKRQRKGETTWHRSRILSLLQHHAPFADPGHRSPDTPQRNARTARHHRTVPPQVPPHGPTARSHGTVRHDWLPHWLFDTMMEVCGADTRQLRRCNNEGPGMATRWGLRHPSMKLALLHRSNAGTCQSEGTYLSTTSSLSGKRSAMAPEGDLQGIVLRSFAQSG